MNNEGLRCPHGKFVSAIQRTGLVVYLHADDHSFCETLNMLDGKPADILKTISVSILEQKEYENFLALDQTLDDVYKNLYACKGCDRRLTELILAFKHSEAVRESLYRRIERLSRGSEADVRSAKILFSLMIVILNSNSVMEDDRKYQKMLGEFYLAVGHSYFVLKNQLKIFESNGLRRMQKLEMFDKSMVFHRKYVYPVHRMDKHPIVF